MSSLLQFRGSVRAGRVGLQFVKVIKGPDWEKYNGPASYKPSPDSTAFCVDDPEHVYTCTTCKRQHARIWIAWRKPVGMFGQWVVFRYNGEKQVPDLSIPISILRLPRDAKPLTDDESSAQWHNNK